MLERLGQERPGSLSGLRRALIHVSLRIARGEIKILWLDLKNAFGSIPHRPMWEMMHRLDVPNNFIEISKVILSNVSEAAGGLTDSI